MNKKATLLFLSLCLVAYSYAQNEIYQVTKSTSLKSRADSDARTLLRLSPNDRLIYLEDCNKYYCKVEFNNKIGWVKKRLIEKVETVEAPTSPIQQEQPSEEQQVQQEEPKQIESTNQEQPIPIEQEQPQEQQSKWGYFYLGIVLS